MTTTLKNDMGSMEVNHFVSKTCIGEPCAVCAFPAAHKVGEEIAHDDPQPVRHNLTAYLCCLHFSAIMGNHGCRVERDDVPQEAEEHVAESKLCIEEIKARVSDADAAWACTDDRDDVRWLLSLVEEAKDVLDGLAYPGVTMNDERLSWVQANVERDDIARARAWLSKVVSSEPVAEEDEHEPS